MSFSSDVKIMLSGLPVKKNCCKKALLLGILCTHSNIEAQSVEFSTDNEKVSSLTSWLFRQCYGIIPYYETTSSIGGTVSYYKMKAIDIEKNIGIITDIQTVLSGASDSLSCANCLSYFGRGLFLASGTVNDPSKKGYHLEMLFKNETIRSHVVKLLSELGLTPKTTNRKGSLSIYFKNSGDIEDFLTVIGAPHAALDLMNVKIMRDIRNNENRRSNCDASNIFRSTGAADIQLRAIKKLMESGRLSLLSADLQKTAMIRYENPECNLIEIASLHEPPLTKSGVNHRLQRIVAFAGEEE